jgi:hypothetical protein
MVASDEGARGRVDPRQFLNDTRVTVFRDGAKLVGRWYEENVTKFDKRSGRDDRVSGMPISSTGQMRGGSTGVLT